MFERCHSSKDAALLLQDQYGLPVQLLGGRPVVTTGSVLGALVMPPALGHDVLAAMNCSYPVPVIADPGERTWTFLVTPPSPMTPVDQHVRHELAEHHVTVVPGGRHILLPTTDSDRGWHWAAEPMPGVLTMPARRTVIEAVHRVVSMSVTPS
ncbi:MAG TPA: hypothetical protein VK083_21210 [Nocardia sp.]|uniref:hypothetical protein n=1 Tax=Nocardia TaxID=1817 RepID=UPI002456232D|nr:MULTISPECIES: hypothetical protein [Nocardia]HLS79308.1 hypothetical protein [Nocardia sp.]